MPSLTLRQIEIVRAVMMTGTIAGAADLLGVSSPGVSRLVKHAEAQLGLRLFERRGGAFLPAAEARAVFDQINEVYAKIAGLETALGRLASGASGALAFGSAPSVAQFIVARAAMRIRERFPALYVDLDVLKIEETVDYLLLERGEFVAMSYAFDHPLLEFRELGAGQLVAVVPDGHPLAIRREVSVHDLAAEPLVGVSPDDPYGAIIAQPFRAEGLDYSLSIRGRLRADRGEPGAPRAGRRGDRRVLGRGRLHAGADADPAARDDPDPHLRDLQARPRALGLRRLRGRPAPGGAARRRAGPALGGAGAGRLTRC